MRFCPAVMPPWTQVYQRFWTKRQRRVTACRGGHPAQAVAEKFIVWATAPFARSATSHPNGT